MDLLSTLRKKIDPLEEGDYTAGLKAVLVHIETAFRHLSRGQDTSDETAFTDAIYRTNQAFEGSIKEAYRVLAGHDPAHKRPFDIENYLEKNNVFRTRVLAQLTTYRKEWRNPSTHDYKLDFDEGEAFLAIVSVCAFACLLLDQIAERLAYIRAQAEAAAQVVPRPLEESRNVTLLDRTVALIGQFCAQHFHRSESERQMESQVVGALHGFLAFAAPDLVVLTEVELGTNLSMRADLVLEDGRDRLILEIKRRHLQSNYSAAVQQVAAYLTASNTAAGVLLFMPEHPATLNKEELILANGGSKLVVLTPVVASAA